MDQDLTSFDPVPRKWTPEVMARANRLFYENMEVGQDYKKLLREITDRESKEGLAEYNRAQQASREASRGPAPVTFMSPVPPVPKKYTKKNSLFNP